MCGVSPYLRPDSPLPPRSRNPVGLVHGGVSWQSAWHTVAAEFRAPCSLTSYPYLRHPFIHRYLLSSYSGPGAVLSAGEAAVSKRQKSWPPRADISQGETATTKLHVKQAEARAIKEQAERDLRKVNVKNVLG